MSGRTCLTILCLLVAGVAVFGIVTSRQVTTLEALAQLEDLKRQRTVAEEELAEKNEVVLDLLSRSHVSVEAERLLGMRTPTDEELVLLPAVR